MSIIPVFSDDTPFTKEELELLSKISSKSLQNYLETVPEYKIPKPKEDTEIVESINFDIKKINIFKRPKQIALVITLDASKISKKDALKHLENIKFELTKMIFDEIPEDILVIDDTYSLVFLDDKYDDWEEE